MIIEGFITLLILSFSSSTIVDSSSTTICSRMGDCTYHEDDYAVILIPIADNDPPKPVHDPPKPVINDYCHKPYDVLFIQCLQ